MNRPIKFRAWDADDKKMCYKVYVGTEGWHGEYWTDGMMTSCFSDINHQDNALMQFTGLHDKNGKEIWEGDIVECSEEHRVVVDYDDHYEGGGCFRMWPCEICRDKQRTHRLEVIGNIYENPELLTHRG